MSCAAGATTFRILDGLVGWDAASFEHLDGAHDPAGVTLASIGGGPGIPPDAIYPYITPARLAYDCGTCTWFLVTPAPPESRLLQLRPCTSCDAWTGSGIETSAVLVAVAVHANLIAAADGARNEVRVWSREGRIEGVIHVEQPTYLAFVSRRELLVVSRRRTIFRFDPAGPALGRIIPPRELRNGIEAIAGAADGSLWIVRSTNTGALTLHVRDCEGHWRAGTINALHEAFAANGLVTVTPGGFCLMRSPRDRHAERCCFTWYGRPTAPPPPPPPTATYERRGQLLTAAIDSGRPRCVWHRVRMDADLPSGSMVELAVATAESDDAPSQGVDDPAWPGFRSGVPHPQDWQVVTGADDLLIRQPPGRFLYVRMRLSGDGFGTPVVRSLRLDFPRATSVDALPAVYRDEPRSEEFTERFVALFDAALEDLDTAFERLPALFDVADTPEDVLPWLGRFLGATFAPAWSATRRRSIITALPALYRQRGTPAGLLRAIELIFDVNGAIEDAAPSSTFGAVGAGTRPSPLDARLGTTRLFGRSRARFRLGASALSGAPLRSHGDPSVDPLTAGVYRFRVLLPAIAGTAARDRLQRLVDSQKPAHTLASVSVASNIPLLTGGMRVGIDTRLGAPPPPVLGAAGNIRLRREAILRGRSHTGHVVGRTPVMSSAC